MSLSDLHERVVDRDHEHLSCVLQRGVVDVAGHVGAGARRACGSEHCLSASGTAGQQSTARLRREGFGSVLKAAGTPMMTPLPWSSLAMLTLLPGEVSTRSMFGMASPTWTLARAVDLNPRAAPNTRGLTDARRRVANMMVSVISSDNVVVEVNGE
jgi:hypothetical protein